MDTLTEPPTITSHHRSIRWRAVGYWLATVLVVAELGLGGIWDIARIPYVRDLVAHLGYPSYFLVLLGSWKLLGAIALLVPRRALLKEWAYAGTFFTYTGAIVSHLATGYDLGEVGLLAILAVLTALSWALRPPSRRIAPDVHRTAGRRGPRHPGVAHTIPATGHGAAGAGEAATVAAWRDRQQRLDGLPQLLGDQGIGGGGHGRGSRRRAVRAARTGRRSETHSKQAKPAKHMKALSGTRCVGLLSPSPLALAEVTRGRISRWPSSPTVQPTGSRRAAGVVRYAAGGREGPRLGDVVNSGGLVSMERPAPFRR
jgi:hypothetical protein